MWLACITRYHVVYACTPSWNRAVACHRGTCRSWCMSNGCMLTWGMWWSSPVSLSMSLSSRSARSQGNILYRYINMTRLLNGLLHFINSSSVHYIFSEPLNVNHRHYVAATNTFWWIQTYCWMFTIELQERQHHIRQGLLTSLSDRQKDDLLCSLSRWYYLLVLQVDSLVDVGVPAYSQLQKLKGQSFDIADTPNGKRKVCTCTVAVMHRSKM